MPIDLLAAAKDEEQRLIATLRRLQAGLSDPNGKGSETEREVERLLLQPQLPPDFRCGKGNIMEGGEAGSRSHAVDRVIYDASVGAPLILGETHSTFPIEVVVAAIEITMSLDGTKFKNDMERLAPFREMRDRQYFASIPMSATLAAPVKAKYVAPRTFVIGLPSNPGWRADKIAELFSNTQKQMRAIVHAAYVVGVGYFQTDLSDRPEGAAPRVYC